MAPKSWGREQSESRWFVPKNLLNPHQTDLPENFYLNKIIQIQTDSIR
jgi:hypothetical protein